MLHLDFTLGDVKNGKADCQIPLESAIALNNYGWTSALQALTYSRAPFHLLYSWVEALTEEGIMLIWGNISGENPIHLGRSRLFIADYVEVSLPFSITGYNSTKTDRRRLTLLVGPHAALCKPAQGPAQLRLSLAQAAPPRLRQLPDELSHAPVLYLLSLAQPIWTQKAPPYGYRELYVGSIPG
jgi:hypothetical protein